MGVDTCIFFQAYALKGVCAFFVAFLSELRVQNSKRRAEYVYSKAEKEI